MRADSDGVLPLPEDATPEKTAFAVENLTYLKTSTCSWTLKEYLGNDDLELEIKELLEFKKTGGQALLDATYIGCRVNDYPNKIRELSRRSGIKIIAVRAITETIPILQTLTPMIQRQSGSA